jgi:hypothetical protein
MDLGSRYLGPLAVTYYEMIIKEIHTSGMFQTQLNVLSDNICLFDPGSSASVNSSASGLNRTAAVLEQSITV